MNKVTQSVDDFELAFKNLTKEELDFQKEFNRLFPEMTEEEKKMPSPYDGVEITDMSEDCFWIVMVKETETSASVS